MKNNSILSHKYRFFSNQRLDLSIFQEYYINSKINPRSDKIHITPDLMEEKADAQTLAGPAIEMSPSEIQGGSRTWNTRHPKNISRINTQNMG